MAAVRRVAVEARTTGKSEVTSRLLPDDDPLRSDPNFLPRISLDLKGDLVILARTPEEAMAVIHFALLVAENPTKVPRGTGRTWNVEGRAMHQVLVVMNEDDAFRVVSKVALGAWRFGTEWLQGSAFDAIRAFVADGEWPSESRLAKEIPLAKGELEEFPDHHIAVVERRGGIVRAVVSLTGLCYEINLAPMPGEPLIGGAVARRDGTETFLISSADAGETLRVITLATTP